MVWAHRTRRRSRPVGSARAWSSRIRYQPPAGDAGALACGAVSVSGQHPTGPEPVVPPPGGGRRLSVGDLLVAVGGVLIVIFSFAPFVAYDKALVESAAGAGSPDFDGWYSAWSAQTFMAPLTWFVVVAGLLLAALAVLRLVRGGNPARGGISATVAELGLALFAFFVLIGYALSAKDMMFGVDDINAEVRAVFDFPLGFSWGGMLMLAGAVLALAGALITHFDLVPALRRASPSAASQPATPYQAPTYPPPMEFHQQQSGGLPPQQPYPPPVQFHEQGRDQEPS
jgi:hypothetical protein